MENMRKPLALGKIKWGTILLTLKKKVGEFKFPLPVEAFDANSYLKLLKTILTFLRHQSPIHSLTYARYKTFKTTSNQFLVPPIHLPTIWAEEQITFLEKKLLHI